MARKAKLVFRGVRRQILNKLKKSIELIDNMDFREAERSTLDERTGDYFGESQPIRTAMQRLQNQANELLALKR